MKNNNRCSRFQFAVIFSIAIFLSACGSGGGGGGGSTSSSSPPPGPTASTLSFPVEATVVTLATTSLSFTLYASDTLGNGYILAASYIPVAPGQPTASKPYLQQPSFIQSGLLKINGVTSGTSTDQVFYSTGPFQVWVSVSGADTMVSDSRTPLPATAKVGATGPIYSGKNYINGSTILPDSQSATWSLEADTADTAWLCINITDVSWSALTDPATGITYGKSVEADCVKINQTGAILGLKVDITTDGTTLKFR